MPSEQRLDGAPVARPRAIGVLVRNIAGKQRALRQHVLDVPILTLAEEPEPDLVADFQAAHDARERVIVRDFDVVDADDDVAPEQQRVPAQGQLDAASLNPGFLRRTARLDHLDEQPLYQRNLQQLAEIFIHELTVKPDPGADHPAVLHERWYERLGEIDRDGKTDVLRVGDDRRADADYLPTAVEQRAAGVAEVDRRIGLNQRFLHRERRVWQQSVEPAHDAAGNGLIESEGVSDGNDFLALPYATGLAELDDRQFTFVGVGNAYERNVEDRVRADQPRRNPGAFVERHRQRLHAVHDVRIGEDQAVLVNDETGT